MKLQVKKNPFVQDKFVVMNEQGTHILGTNTGVPFSDNGVGARSSVAYYENKDSLLEWHDFIPLDEVQDYFKAEAAREKKNQAARKRRKRLQQELVDKVLAQIVRDVEVGDLTAIEELIKAIPTTVATQYLPEGEGK